MNRCRIVSLILICLAFAIPARAGVFDPSDALKRANALVEQEKYDQALNELLYSLLEAEGEERSQVLSARSNILARQGAVLEALEEMDRAVASAPENPCIRMDRAIMYYTFGEPGLARIDAFSALGAGCTEKELTALIARLYFADGDYINAIEWFYDLYYDPEFRIDALGSIGISYSVMGYPKIAAEYFRTAIEEFPENPRLHAELADVLIVLGDFEQATAEYEKSFENSEPADPAAMNNYGYTLVLMGEKEKAHEVFEKMNEETPTVFSLCNMLELALENEDWQAASVYGSMCMKEFGSNPRLMERERYYFMALRRALTTLMEDDMAVHPLTQRDLAEQHLEFGERTQALSALLMAIMMDPLNTEISFEAGRLLMEFGETSRGASYLNMAASLAGPESDIAKNARTLINDETMSLFGKTIITPIND